MLTGPRALHARLAAAALALVLVAGTTGGQRAAGRPRVYPHSGTSTVDTTATPIVRPPTLRTGLHTLARLADTLAEEVTPKGANGTGDSLAIAAAVDSALASLPVIVPEENARVDRFLASFTGPKRRTFQRWLDRSGPYFPLVASILQRAGLPVELACVIFIESGFNLGARSWAEAVGPWQFIASPARIFGLSVTRDIDERHDMERSSVAAARLFAHLYDMFGSWPLVLAAYDSGEGTVGRAIQRQGTTDYWAMHLPRETENYVPQFMATLLILRDPLRYGFTLPGSEPLVFHEVAVPRRTHLASFARRVGVPPAEIAILNPMYRRGWAPAGARLRIPIGVAPEKLSSAVAEAGSDSLTSGRTPAPPGHRRGRTAGTSGAGHERTSPRALTVRVRSGENAWTIAHRAGISSRDLLAWNGLRTTSRLRPGQVLRLTPPRADAADADATRKAGTGTRRVPRRSPGRARRTESAVQVAAGAGAVRPAER